MRACHLRDDLTCCPSSFQILDFQTSSSCLAALFLVQERLGQAMCIKLQKCHSPEYFMCGASPPNLEPLT